MADKPVVVENPLGLKKFRARFRVEVTGEIELHAEDRKEATNMILFPDPMMCSEDDLLVTQVENRKLEAHRVIYIEEVKEVKDG